MAKKMTKSSTECPNEDLLVSYVEQGLKDWEAGPVEEHLATCDSCAERTRELHRYRQMWGVLRDTHEPVFAGLEPGLEQDPSLELLLKEWGGRVWSAAKLIYKLPDSIPELISTKVFTSSPFDQFALGTISEPIRTLGSIRTRGGGDRQVSTRAVAHSKGQGGRHEIQIVFDEKTRETVALLNHWTGGPPPRLAVRLIPSKTAGGSEQMLSVEWTKVRPGHFRAALPSSPELAAEVVVVLGPPKD